jgi:hypothetical protein
MENTKLTEQEVQSLLEFQQQRQTVAFELGNLELTQIDLDSRKEELETYYLELKTKEQQLGTELSNKHGNGSIDLEKGEFIPS